MVRPAATQAISAVAKAVHSSRRAALSLECPQPESGVYFAGRLTRRTEHVVRRNSGYHLDEYPYSSGGRDGHLAPAVGATTPTGRESGGYVTDSNW